MPHRAHVIAPPASIGPSMASSPRQPQPLIARFLSKQLERTLDALRRGPDEATSVHRGRVAIKKTRAAMRLIGGALSAQELERQQSRLRLLARTLATARDASARSATIDQLQRRFNDLLPDAAIAGFRRQLARAQRKRGSDETARYGRLLPTATATWQILARWATLITPRLLRRGLSESLESAGRAFRRARKNPTAARLHRWRKRVKDLLYQCQLLRALGGAQLKRFERSCAALAESLGSINDLGLLRGDLRQGAGARACALVVPLTRRFEKELRRTALRRGERVHSKRMTRLVRTTKDLVPASRG
jgi:CHAD domain-containing protein